MQQTDDKTGRLPLLALLTALVMVAGGLLMAGPAAADLDPDADPDEDGYDFNGDGTIDAEERFTNAEEFEIKTGTDPFDEDTDDDGILDGWEAYYWYIWDEFYKEIIPETFNPLNASDADDDPDGDNATNLVEFLLGTDPLDRDSDDDGDPDGGDPPPLPPGPPPGTKPDDGGYGPVVNYQIFRPELGSLKRWTAFDALYFDEVADPDNPYTLYVYDPTMTQIYPTNSTDYNFIFDGWVWMGLQVSPDSYTPLFSVAPEAEIIAYDPNSTQIDVEFFKDGADNFFVKSTTISGTIDLRYWMGTNGSYFNLNIPAGLTVSDIPTAIQRPITPSGANTTVEERVKEFLMYNESNPSLYNLWNDGYRETNLAKIVSNLTAYFGSFDGVNEPDPHDPGSGLDLYQWLAVGGKGACRQRSFVFATTALALGVPTRYVQNEQHVFVEVFIPDGSGNVTSDQWHRINLGGAFVDVADYPRPDDEDPEPGDDFRFGDNDPGDESNMTGDPVTVVLTQVAPTLGDKLTRTFTATGHVRNGSRFLPDVAVGLGLWDSGHAFPTLEVATGATNSTGYFTIAFTAPGPVLRGFNELYAASYQTGLLGVSDPLDLEVAANSTLTANLPASVGLGQQLIISGDLRDVGGLVAPNESLAFRAWKDGTFRNWLGETTTDELGNFLFTYNVTNSSGAVGEWRIYTFYNGSTYLHNSSTFGLLNLMAATVDLVAALEPDTVLLGQTFWVNGSLSADAWDKGELEVQMGARKLLTQAPGGENWSLTLTAPTDLPAGDYLVTVSFLSQDPSYPDERVTLGLTLIGTSTLTLDDAVAVRNQELTLTGRLVDHLGSPLAGGSVTLEWRGGHLADLLTNPDGSFQHTFTVPLAEALGELDLGALFGGDGYHTASTANASVELSQQPLLTLDSLTPAVAFVGDTLQVRGTFTADNGSALAATLWYGIAGSVMGTVSAANGSFNLTYTLPDAGWEVGPYTLSVDYLGEPPLWALPASDQAGFALMKEVHLTLEGLQAHRGDSISLTGTATDELGHGLDGLALTAEWGGNGLPLPAFTDSNGLYSFPYTVANAQLLGPVTATVTFDNGTDPYYVAASVQALYTVVSELTITVEGAKVYRNSTVTFTGTVVDDQGDPPDQELQFNLFWDGEYLGRVTADTGGRYNFDYLVAPDEGLGLHTLQVVFPGFGWYLASEGQATYTVWANTTTTLLEWDTPVVVNRKLHLEGLVLDDRGQGLDGNVTLRWDGGFKALVEVVAGRFITDITVSNTATAANHTLEARWPSGNYLEGSSDTVTVVVRRPTNLTVEADPAAARNTTVTFSGRLQDHLVQGVGDRPVEVYWDDSYVATATTDPQGYWSVSHDLPADTALGPHILSATYAESTYYLASSGRADWEVWTATSVSLTGMRVDRIQNITFNVRLVDDQQQGLANRSLTLAWPILGNLSLTTDSQGYGQLELGLPAAYPLGPLTAYLFYVGQPYHYPSQAQADYQVWANTTIDFHMDNTTMAGQTVPFNGTFSDDVGAPVSGLLRFGVNGNITRDVTVTNGTFNGVYFVSAQNQSGYYQVQVDFPGSDPDYLYSTQATLELVVRHDSRITLDEATGLLNQTFQVNGTMLDEVGNPVGPDQIGRLAFTWDGQPLAATPQAQGGGRFTLLLLRPLGEPVGLHLLAADFPGDALYNPSNASASLTLRSRTLLLLETPEAVGEGALFKFQVTLTLEDGQPLSGARLYVRLPPTPESPQGSTTMLLTDGNGTARYETLNTGNTSHPMQLKVSYNGDNYHLASQASRTITAVAPPAPTNNLLLFGVIVAGVATGGAVLLGLKYRQRHLRQLRQIVATTADALERGDDYNKTVYQSYVQLCRVLQHYGYLRKDHETAREFARALEAALPVDSAPVGKLTRLYEVVDYSEHNLEVMDRDEAIASLRAVETALSSWSLAQTQT